MTYILLFFRILNALDNIANKVELSPAKEFRKTGKNINVMVNERALDRGGVYLFTLLLQSFN